MDSAHMHLDTSEWMAWQLWASMSDVQEASAASSCSWVLWLVLALYVTVICFMAKTNNFAEKEQIALSSFSKRDRHTIGRLVLPESAVREKKQRCEGRYAVRLYESFARPVSGHSWSDFELIIGDGMWAPDFHPMLVFVNSRSGGKQGTQLLLHLHSLLHRLQVVNLEEEGPEAALQWWSTHVKKYRILVCGGDGTVGWVLSSLETLKLDYMPPVAILPLGTGNDLARTLGWGGGFQGGNVIAILKQVAEARVTLLDRWTVVCRDLVPQRTGRWARNGLQNDDSSASKVLKRQERKKPILMNNYMGIGLDAAIALDFHQMREEMPELFFSRMVNKLWYGWTGFLALLLRKCTQLHSKCTLVCDGKVITIPADVEGVVVLNIPSFAGGSDLWGAAGTSEDGSSSDGSDSACSQMEQPLTFTRPSTQDNRLEVVGVSSLRLGAAQVGMGAAKRLAQCSTVKIYNEVSMPVQVDGEPWIMEEGGEVEISWKGEAFMLARSSMHADTIATDVIDWALQRSIIDVKQRNELMKETARRMQQSRVRAPSFQRSPSFLTLGGSS